MRTRARCLAALGSIAVALPGAGAAMAQASLAPAGWAPNGSPWTPLRAELRSDARDGRGCAANAALLFRVRSSGTSYGSGEGSGEDPLGGWAVGAGSALVDKGWRVHDMQASDETPAAVRDQMTRAAGRCRARRILVAGAGDGAVVLRKALAGLGRAARAQIAGVDLVADAATPRGHVSWHALGAADARRLGRWPIVTIDAALAGVAEHGSRLGSPRAPIVLDDFMDLQCPYCREYVEAALPTLIARYVRDGDVQIVLEPLAFIGEDSLTAARYAVAAGLQDRLWPFAVRFFARQGEENAGYVTSAFLAATAADVPGLDFQAMSGAADAPAVQEDLDRAARRWARFRMTGVPSFALGRRGGPLHEVGITSFAPSDLSVPIERLLHPRLRHP